MFGLSFKKSQPDVSEQQVDKNGLLTGMRMVIPNNGHKYVRLEDVKKFITDEALLTSNPKCRARVFQLLDRIKDF